MRLWDGMTRTGNKTRTKRLCSLHVFMDQGKTQERTWVSISHTQVTLLLIHIHIVVALWGSTPTGQENKRVPPVQLIYHSATTTSAVSSLPLKYLIFGQSLSHLHITRTPTLLHTTAHKICSWYRSSSYNCQDFHGNSTADHRTHCSIVLTVFLLAELELLFPSSL